jgi:metal-dependent hydrolase (beta-lactamase superfamily II)
MPGEENDSMKSHPVNITIVVDNQAGPGLATEHGLALHIESAGRHILFDTGQGRALTTNARPLGIALEQVDTQVLSHGHYDHTGGLAGVLRAGGQRLERTIATLRSVAPEMVVPCHCTGEHAIAASVDALGKKVLPGAAGMTFQF